MPRRVFSSLCIYNTGMCPLWKQHERRIGLNPSMYIVLWSQYASFSGGLLWVSRWWFSSLEWKHLSVFFCSSSSGMWGLRILSLLSEGKWCGSPRTGHQANTWTQAQLIWHECLWTVEGNWSTPRQTQEDDAERPMQTRGFESSWCGLTVLTTAPQSCL